MVSYFLGMPNSWNKGNVDVNRIILSFLTSLVDEIILENGLLVWNTVLFIQFFLPDGIVLNSQMKCISASCIELSSTRRLSLKS